MPQNARWAKRLAALIIVPMAALVTAGVPAYASSSVHPSVTSHEQSYQNMGSGLNSSDNCMYVNGTDVAIGRPAFLDLCLTTAEYTFNWIEHDNSGTYTLESRSDSGYCLAITSANDAYITKCNGQTSTLWSKGSGNEFTWKSKVNGFCLGVGSSSHNVEARTCTGTTYQKWED